MNFGAVVLFGALVVLRESLGLLAPAEYDGGLAVIIAACLFVADLWAVLRRRLCPLSQRRQAVKSVLYGGYREGFVGFVWGFDVGLGVTTYRVTTGVWLLAALVILGMIPAWTAFVFVGAFAASLLTVAAVPGSLRGSEEARVEGSLRRIEWLGTHRRWVQTIYLALTPLALVSLLASH